VGFEIVVPDSVRGGFYRRFGNWTFGLMAHSLQSDQVWVFLISCYLPEKRRSIRFGYRTKGEAAPKYSSWFEWGWHWPWKYRLTAGRG
jgi:hypothetical protein